MSTETCKLCNEECTPWVHINGHICNDCAHPNDRWINVEDELPEHREIILAYTQKGYCVSCFVVGEKMNKELYEAGLPISPNVKQYYFSSQEVRGNTLNNVTHWMPLPEKPE